VLLVALLSSSSTTPVSQPNDMALPVRDLSTPPDLSVLDLALPSPTGKKTGKKSLPQGQSPPKKDKSSLKYYVPQNL
jgi:hypothetical protein